MSLPKAVRVPRVVKRDAIQVPVLRVWSSMIADILSVCSMTDTAEISSKSWILITHQLMHWVTPAVEPEPLRLLVIGGSLLLVPARGGSSPLCRTRSTKAKLSIQTVHRRDDRYPDFHQKVGDPATLSVFPGRSLYHWQTHKTTLIELEAGLEWLSLRYNHLGHLDHCPGRLERF